MKKAISLLISAGALFGFANASNVQGAKKIELVTNIDENVQLMLEHSLEVQSKIDNMIENANEFSYHYSHRSHQSHRSHYSHYSSYN